MIRLARIAFLGLAVLLVGGLLVTAQDPPKKDGDPKGEKGKGDFKGKGGFGQGFPGGPGGGFTRSKPGTVLAVSLQETLKMTDEQKKELEVLQKMVDEKLGKILSEDQQKQLKEMGEHGAGGFGRPGGGAPGGRPGAGNPPPKKDN